MHLADPMIEQTQQAGEQLVSTYKRVLNADGMFVSAISQFESEHFILAEAGWQLKRVSHQGSIVFPTSVVIAIYEK
ncbi:MAG TPA: hypothetical protein VFN35_09970 [Ktedonobacteraceae bacterium]|nr:hypothetical protein [Ktedonobacteraceae bacterium]